MESLTSAHTHVGISCGESEDQLEEVEGGSQAATHGESSSKSNDGNRLNATQCLRCQFCPEILFGIFKLNKHLKKVHNARISITCNLCGDKFKRNKEFKTHLASHISSTERSHVQEEENRRYEMKVNCKNKNWKTKIKPCKKKVVKKREIKPSKKKVVKKREVKPAQARVKASIEATTLHPPLARTSAETKSDKNTDPSCETMSCHDKLQGCDNDVPESAILFTENELEKPPGGSNNGEPTDNLPTVVHLVTEFEDESNVEFLNEIEPPQKRNKTCDIQGENWCRNCNLSFKTSELAALHSALHTLKVNVQFRCSTCLKYLNDFPEYQRHVESRCRWLPEKPQTRLELPESMHNDSGNDRLTCFQSLQRAKAFPLPASLQVPHCLNVSLAMSIADPLMCLPVPFESESNDNTAPSQESMSYQDAWEDCDNDFPESTSLSSEPTGHLPTSHSVTEVQEESDVEFLKEVQPHQKRSKPFHIQIENWCTKCNLTFKTAELATLHSALHTLKVNVQFRCLTCHRYLNDLPEYQRHVENRCRRLPEKPKTHLELHVRNHNENGNDRLTCFQSLQCAKTFPSLASLRVHHRLRVSHAVPTANPLEINSEPKKCIVVQPKKLMHGKVVEKNNFDMTLFDRTKFGNVTTVLVNTVKVETPTEKEEYTPKVNPLSKIVLPSVNLLFKMPKCGLSSTSTTNIIPKILETNKRKASRKEVISSVMYHGFEEDVSFLDLHDNETFQPTSTQKLPTQNYDQNDSGPDNDKTYITHHEQKERISYRMIKNQYNCGECGRKFTRERMYKAHLDVHKGINPHRCPHCLKYFSSSCPLLVHIQSFHDPKAAEKRFHCTQCSNRYASNAQLRNHLYRHRRNKFVCETCGRRFFTSDTFEEHTRAHWLPLEEAPYKCTLCDMRFFERRRYDYHIKRHGKPDMRLNPDNPNLKASCDICGSRMSTASFHKHMLLHEPGFKKPLSCPHCDKGFFKVAAKNKHLLTHPEHTGNICPRCYKEFSSKEILEDHQSQHPPIKKPSLICDVCGKCLSTQRGLKRHKVQHYNQPTFQCHECGKVFRNRCYLKSHSRTHSNTKPFSCQFCDFRYNYPSVGFMHRLQSHFGRNGFRENDKLNREKKFFCEVCDIGFVKEASLLQHRIYHLGTKTVKCKRPNCEETFFTIYDRSHHVRVNHSPRKICEFCGKGFRVKQELDIHKRYKHTGETPFSCNFCDKKYKSHGDLRYHLDTHAGNYRFKCDFCEKKFISKTNMYAHLRIHTNYQCRKCGIPCGSAKAWKEHRCEGKMKLTDTIVELGDTGNPLDKNI